MKKPTYSPCSSARTAPYQRPTIGESLAVGLRPPTVPGSAPLGSYLDFSGIFSSLCFFCAFPPAAAAAQFFFNSTGREAVTTRHGCNGPFATPQCSGRTTNTPGNTLPREDNLPRHRLDWNHRRPAPLPRAGATILLVNERAHTGMRENSDSLLLCVREFNCGRDCFSTSDCRTEASGSAVGRQLLKHRRR